MLCSLGCAHLVGDGKWSYVLLSGLSIPAASMCVVNLSDWQDAEEALNSDWTCQETAIEYCERMLFL